MKERGSFELLRLLKVEARGQRGREDRTNILGEKGCHGCIGRQGMIGQSDGDLISLAGKVDWRIRR
jgi:hypothetical protein